MENQKTDLRQHFLSLETDQNKLLSEFEKPIYQNIFFNNMQLLQTNSDFISFNTDKWYMRPELFCRDHYQNPFLYQLIMLINDIKTIFEFVPDNLTDRIIIAPYAVEIKKLLSYV